MWSPVTQKYSSKEKKEFDYHEFCSTLLFLPDNNLPLQSNNNLNTNRRAAFQKVMNSEALEPRQAWFKCTAPATQRGYQLYSPAIEEAKIIFQRVIARKRKKRKRRKCHRNHTIQSKQFQEQKWVAKSCQRQPSLPRGKKRDGNWWLPSCHALHSTHLSMWCHFSGIVFGYSWDMQKSTFFICQYIHKHFWKL